MADLLMRCDSCREEENCHPISDLRWSVAMPGYSGVEPDPVCQECWETAIEDHPSIKMPEWSDLRPIVIPTYAAGYRAGLEAATAEAKRVGDRARAFAMLPSDFSNEYHVGRGTAASEIAAVVAALPIPEVPHE